MTVAPRPRSQISGLGWSGAHLVVSRLSTVAAVPLILTQLGDAVYTAWVLAGTVVMAQGLVDLGMGAATIRYVALAKVAGARHAVGSVLRRSLVFYIGLSVLVGGLLVALRGPLVGAVPALDEPAAAGDARRLVVYAAVAFALTSLVAVGAAALQGLDRVAEAYRARTIGWLVYAPVLAASLAAGAGVDALGLAWLAAYGCQAALVALALPAALRVTGTHGDVRVSNRDLLALGTSWQVSSWADFASLQLPRIAAGLTLSAPAVVQLDLALRAGQIAVAPFFALLPLVLPAASREWGAGGSKRLAVAAARWDRAFSSLLVLAAAASLPLLAPAIAIWSSRELQDVNMALVTLVLLGTVAHTRTGLMTSVLLAAGDVRPIIGYKVFQLLLALALVPVGAALGLVELGVAVAIAMTLPSARFMRRARNRLAGDARARDGVGRIGASAAALSVPGLAVALAAPGDASPVGVLAVVGGAVLAGASIALPLSRLRSTLDQVELRAQGPVA